MRLKVSSAKRWPFCLGLNVLNMLPLSVPAEDMLKAQQGKLNEARDDFHRLLRYLSVKDATEQVR